MKVNKVLFVFLFCVIIPVVAMDAPGQETKDIAQNNLKIKPIDSLQQLCKQPLVARWQDQELRAQEVTKLLEYHLQNNLSYILGSVYLSLHSTVKQKLKKTIYAVIPVQELCKLKGHTTWVKSVAFSPNSKLLASGSEDNTVRLWDTETLKELATLTGHTSNVNSAVFSPNGKLLASGSWDKTIRLWDLQELHAALYVLDNEILLQEAIAAVQWAKKDDNSEIPIQKLHDLMKKE